MCRQLCQRKTSISICYSALKFTSNTSTIPRLCRNHQTLDSQTDQFGFALIKQLKDLQVERPFCRRGYRDRNKQIFQTDEQRSKARAKTFQTRNTSGASAGTSFSEAMCYFVLFDTFYLHEACAITISL